ncbi:MAG TPA: hypothetical protein VF211_03400 [Burkholderiales bacterium]
MNVHLVGSIGLDSVEEVFATAGRLLGRNLKRIPDGEVGPRRLWVSFQYPLLRSSPYLRPDPSGEVRPTSRFPKLCLAEGVSVQEVTFGELGYAREAKGSYLDFCAARSRGEIPQGVRFQVCLPTPMGVVYAFCTERDVLAIDAAYEQAMIREVERICRAIPHRDLCLQWDFCHEMIILDGQPQSQFPTLKASLADIMARMARLAAAVPREVELGVHLCYGDFAAKHFAEPKDMGRMVEVANALVAALGRPLTYLHMPVPVGRSDDAYFAPLAKLRFDGELYLGVVHAADGVDGARKRMAAAARYAPRFGIACECGIARARRPELVRRLLEIHAEAAA